MKDLFSLREEEIFNTLKALQRCSFVVIGGYAVNVYTLPRFSVDCDIVIKEEKELKNIEKILFSIGYKKKITPENIPYSGKFCRYEKRLSNSFLVSIDLLVESVMDRDTRVIFSAEWVFEHSSIKILRGKTMMEELRLKIVNVDALIVMKTISCRSTDIRDIFMMLPNTENKGWIISEISVRYDLGNRLSKIIETVNSKQFKDGLSGVYGKLDQKTFEKHKKAILSLIPL